MKLLVDSADLEEIKRIYDLYPIDGVTTNPSILLKANQKPYLLLKKIREFIGKKSELHVQVISLKAEKMINEAKTITEKLGSNTYVKIPTIPEGIKAIKYLSKSGYNVTATAVYNPMQAYLAAKAGAKYVAPYVNRIDNLGYDGIEVVKKIQKIIDLGNYETEILSASFKNSQQIQALSVYGIQAATVAPDTIDSLVNGKHIIDAVEKFKEDFETLCDVDKTMQE